MPAQILQENAAAEFPVVGAISDHHEFLTMDNSHEITSELSGDSHLFAWI